MVERTGGCLCGNIRYAVEGAPLATAVCHCRNCQKQAGSALSVIAVFPRAALALDGELKVFEDKGTSGQAVYRQFCPECGSPVLTDTPGAQAADIIFIKAGTLDDVSDLKPSTHYWAKSAQPWMPLPDDVERLEQE
ncbi:MAG: GFA family protein [Alphaproteobacteria bacterium]